LNSKKRLARIALAGAAASEGDKGGE